MKDTIESRMSRHEFGRAIWLMPAVFAVHILEEFAGGFPEWVTNVIGGSFHQSVFVANNAIFMTIMLSLTIWTSRSMSRLPVFLLVFWASANLFWDGLFHIVATAAFDRYSPGLITSVLLYIPISLAVAWITLYSRMLPISDFTAAAAMGLALFVFVVWYGLFHFAT